MTQGEPAPSNTTTASTTLAPTTTTAQGADLQIIDKDDNPSLADTIAAVTIAVLACVLIITLTLIVRAIRKRRQRQRGQELNRIPTVSTGIISANVVAYGGHRSPRPARGVISWEPITPSASNADAMASSSAAGAPSSC